MIFKTINIPTLARIGDVWLCPHNSFKRVLSRGGAWENVNLGSKHPDEKDHDHEQGNEPKAEQRHESTEVSGGAGESSPGNGDDGEVPGGGDQQPEGKEDPGLTGEPSAPSLPGVDANGSEAV